MNGCSSLGMSSFNSKEKNPRNPSSDNGSCGQVSVNEMTTLNNRLNLLVKEVRSGSLSDKKQREKFLSIFNDASPGLKDRIEMVFIRDSIKKIIGKVSRDQELASQREAFSNALLNRVDIIKKYNEESTKLFFNKKLWESKIRMSGNHLTDTAEVLINSIKVNNALTSDEKDILYQEVNLGVQNTSAEVNAVLAQNIAKLESQVYMVRNSAVLMAAGVVALGAAYSSAMLLPEKFFGGKLLNGMIYGAGVGVAAVVGSDTHKAIRNAYNAVKMDDDFWCAMKESFDESEKSILLRTSLGGAAGFVGGSLVLGYTYYGLPGGFFFNSLTSMVIASGSLYVDRIAREQLINDEKVLNQSSVISQYLELSGNIDQGEQLKPVKFQQMENLLTALISVEE